VKAKKANYTERLLDGLRVYHNPLATHPLDRGVFRHPDVFQSSYSEASDVGLTSSGRVFFFLGGLKPL
jgi:hypothetical protein